MMPDTFIVKMPEDLALSDDELLRLCEANRELRIERDVDGNLIVMTPSGSWTSNLNSKIIHRLFSWNERTKLGVVFDSSGGFVLPNGAMRAPDASWIPLERWERFSPEERRKFLPLCPDFVIELRSPSDRLADLQAKMEEWMANGCRLGWLLDPVEETAYVYRADGSPSVVDDFDEMLSGEDVLPGFVFALSVLR